MSSSLVEKIVSKVAALPDEQQQVALEYVESLAERSAAQGNPGERKSLMGAFAHMGLSVTDEDIREVRREMWHNFPREEP